MATFFTTTSESLINIDLVKYIDVVLHGTDEPMPSGGIAIAAKHVDLKLTYLDDDVQIVEGPAAQLIWQGLGLDQSLGPRPFMGAQILGAQAPVNLKENGGGPTPLRP